MRNNPKKILGTLLSLALIFFGCGGGGGGNSASGDDSGGSQISSCPSGSPLPEDQVIYYAYSPGDWTRIPSIAISAVAGDARIQLAEEAVNYWNALLLGIGTPFKLGSIAWVAADKVPGDFLVALSAWLSQGGQRPETPESVRQISGDIIVALSDADFVSFSTRLESGVVMIGIRNGNEAPLNLTNVARNVIAHELGHAIGLGHNNDATKLMCGRPADCRPQDFHCDIEQFFAITEFEKDILFNLYPNTWKPS